MTGRDAISRRAAAIAPSGIRKFFDIVSEMKDAISLGVGEPDFVTPWEYCDAAITSIERGETHYTSNKGTMELRRAIAKYNESRFAVRYDPEAELLVTVGASEGIDLALRALVNEGEEVLVPSPSYVSYAPGVVLSGGVPVPIKTTEDNGFKITAGDVDAAVTPRTKALILPYPNNPTGAILGREELKEIAEVVLKRDLVVISDEIYAELTYGGQRHVSFASLPGMFHRTVTLNGFSKAFAMTGWRLGYVGANREWLDAMLKIHQYVIMCAPTMAQAAALAALKSGFENQFAEVERMRREYDMRRNIMVKGLNAMGLHCFEPKGAFYVFPSIKSTGLTSEVFCERLLRERRVAVVPGTAFGACGEGHVRCSYATSAEKLKEALARIRAFLDDLG